MILHERVMVHGLFLSVASALSPSRTGEKGCYQATDRISDLEYDHIDNGLGTSRTHWLM